MVGEYPALPAGRIGVPHHELLGPFRKVLRNLTAPSCFVSGMDHEPSIDAGFDQFSVRVSSLTQMCTWLDPQTEPVSLACYLALWRREASPALLGTLRSVAPEESRLFFVDPTASIGLAGWTQRIGRVALLKRLGLSFHRDVPMLLRTAGWEPTTVQRFSAGFPAGVMTFVAGEARAY